MKPALVTARRTSGQPPSRPISGFEDFSD